MSRHATDTLRTRERIKAALKSPKEDDRMTKVRVNLIEIREKVEALKSAKELKEEMAPAHRSVKKGQKAKDKEDSERKKKFKKAFKKEVEGETHEVPTYGGIITCEEPIPDGRIKRGKDGHYFVSLEEGGEKVSIPRLVYCVRLNRKPPNASRKECVYHLCGNIDCCKLEHLRKGKVLEKNSRTKCSGLLQYKGHRMLVVACKHKPMCRKITVMDDDETIDDIEEYEVIDPDEVDKERN